MNLKIDDIKLDEKIMMIRGKGGKCRVVPFGDRSLLSSVKYLNKRNKLFEKEGVLFLTKFGDPLTFRMTDKIIERVGKKARVENVRLSAHTFRHTFAKNWLMNSGDISSLQKILGHRTLDMVTLIATSQIMTSKKPIMGAKYLSPLETKTMRNVPILTSTTLARKIKRGSMTHINKSVSMIESMFIFMPYRLLVLIIF